MPPKASIWICTFDPSGDFTGSKFDEMSLQYTARLANFEPNTKFVNTLDPNRTAVYNHREIIFDIQMGGK